MRGRARAFVGMSLFAGSALWGCQSNTTVMPPVMPAPEALAVAGPPSAVPPLQAAPEAPPTARPAPSEVSSHPKIDLVFALDTTGSMSGMIEGAKAKIWELARRAQEGRPAPELRVGLVAYRDLGDEYVTKVLPLTADMDAVYATLTEFHAAGGGDAPEHVLKGLYDAVNVMQWTGDPGAVKLVYLVGDAPPHFDYQDGITLEGVVGGARRKSIRISAIRCGGDDETLASFTRIAGPTQGEVATIEQSGGVVARAATPYDEKLARLNAELAATEIHYGSARERAEADRVVQGNLSAPVTTQADRATFYGARAAGSVTTATKKDLVAVAPTALAGLKEADLPEALRRMSPAERAKFIEQQRQRRQKILAKVRALKAESDEYAAKAPAAPAPARALDTKVFDVLKRAAAGKVGF